MKKLKQKASFLTKILLVVGLLISNLSSLSVVFAYEGEVAEDVVIELVDNILEINKRLENDKILFSKDQLAKIDFTINTTSLSIEEISTLIYEKYQEFCCKR